MFFRNLRNCRQTAELFCKREVLNGMIFLLSWLNMTQNETDLKQSRGTLVLQDCGSLQNILVKKGIYLLFFTTATKNHFWAVDSRMSPTTHKVIDKIIIGRYIVGDFLKLPPNGWVNCHIHEVQSLESMWNVLDIVYIKEFQYWLVGSQSSTPCPKWHW